MARADTHGSPLLKIVFAIAASFILTAVITKDASAQFHWNFSPRFGADLLNERTYVGLETRIPVPHTRIMIQSSLDHHLVPDERFALGIATLEVEFSIVQSNFNVLYLLDLGAIDAPAIPYIGAGLALTRVSADGTLYQRGQFLERASSRDVGLGVNLLAGALFSYRQVEPFITGNLTLGSSYDLLGVQTNGGDFVSVTIGVLFRIPML